MPTYTYKCTKCTKVFDVYKPISQYKDIEKCEKCKAPSPRYFDGETAKVYHVPFEF